MTVVERYQNWLRKINDFVNILGEDDSDTFFTFLENKEQILNSLLEEITEYNIHSELEKFILNTKEAKEKEGFIKSVQENIDYVTRRWEKKYNFDQLERAQDEKILYRTHEVKYLIYKFDGYLDNVYEEFNKIRSAYTSTPLLMERSFYRKISRKFISKLPQLEDRKYTFKNWQDGSLYSIVLKRKILGGESIEEFIETKKLEYFNIMLRFDGYDRNLGLEAQLENLILHALSSVNDAKIIWGVCDLLEKEEWWKILDCQKKMYDIYVDYEFKYLFHCFNLMAKSSIDKSLLISDLITEIEELLQGKRNKSTFTILQDIEDIAPAFLDVKRGIKYSRNLRYSKVCFKPFDPMTYVSQWANAHTTATALYNFKGYLESLVKIKANLTKNSEKEVASYKFLGSEKELRELYNKLKEKYIDKKTTFAMFKKVFNESTDKDFSPVKWRSGNASELLYFIKALKEREYLQNTKRWNYSQLKMCFVKENGQEFSEKLKNLTPELETNLNIKKRRELDNLVVSLFN